MLVGCGLNDKQQEKIDMRSSSYPEAPKMGANATYHKHCTLTITYYPLWKPEPIC